MKNTTPTTQSTTLNAILDYMKEHPMTTRQEVAEAIVNITEDMH